MSIYSLHTMSFQQLFKLGMKRNIPEFLEFPGTTYNIGSSQNDTWQIPGAIALGKPDWNYPIIHQAIPAPNDSVSTIHCYHFLEHLSGQDAISFLRECERIMIPGSSVFNFCMPYYKSNLQAECLDHKSQWNENSFRNLFENHGYDVAGAWTLRIHAIMIAGIKEDNLCVIGQLRKALNA